MYARIVKMKLKDNRVIDDFTKTFETQIIPMLRKQEGFQDEIALFSPERLEVRGISFWKNMETAQNYHRNVYPEILKTISKVVEGTPEVLTYEVQNSTMKNLATHEPARS